MNRQWPCMVSTSVLSVKLVNININNVIVFILCHAGAISCVKIIIIDLYNMPDLPFWSAERMLCSILLKIGQNLYVIMERLC